MPFKEYDNPHLHDGYKALREGRYIDAIYYLGGVRYIPPGPSDDSDLTSTSSASSPRKEPGLEVIAARKSLCELIANHPAHVPVLAVVDLLQRAYAIDLASPFAQKDLKRLHEYVEALFRRGSAPPLSELFRPV